MDRKGPSDGLQGERTSLAWTRTSFAVLGNGALFMVREVERFHGPFRMVPVVLAGVVAAVTYLAGYRRQRRLSAAPGRDVSPRLEVWVIGTSVIVLIVVSCALLPL